MNYNIEQRSKNANIKIVLKNGLTFDAINEKINLLQNAEQYHDDISYKPNICRKNNIDFLNYMICANSIKQQCDNMKNIGEKRLFKFKMDDYCKLTNYLYMTVFFGPSDETNFFNGKFNHVAHMIKYNVNMEISIENNVIYFALCSI